MHSVVCCAASEGELYKGLCGREDAVGAEVPVGLRIGPTDRCDALGVGGTRAHFLESRSSRSSRRR
eukprot:6846648-Pyramimonas_sp.AAC.1